MSKRACMQVHTLMRPKMHKMCIFCVLLATPASSMHAVLTLQVKQNIQSCTLRFQIKHHLGPGTLLLEQSININNILTRIKAMICSMFS